MSRRRTRRSPVEERATDVADAARLNQVLTDLMQALPAYDSSLIRRIANGQSLEVIAAENKWTMKTARARFDSAMSAIVRHAILDSPQHGNIGDYEHISDAELHGVARQIELPVMSLAGQPDVVWCDHHGLSERRKRPTCQGCPCELAIDPFAFRFSYGRPRRYCSNACRQRAYRRRRAERVSGAPAGAPAPTAVGCRSTEQVNDESVATLAQPQIHLQRQTMPLQ